MGEETVISSWTRDSNENQKREVNKIWMHVTLFKLLDIRAVIFIIIFMFQ
jgi:hypothetical protein